MESIIVGPEISIDQIVIPENRLRREFALQEIVWLGESIFSKGLMHPIVLRDDMKTLVAGERRLRAAQWLYKQGKQFMYEANEVAFGMIPFSLLGNLSEELLIEAELEENIRRVDLSWAEKSSAIARLDALRRTQNANWNTNKTAQEVFAGVSGGAVGSRHTAIANELLLAKHLGDPEVAEAKTAAEALKVIKRKKQNEFNSLLASVSRGSEKKHSIILGNAYEELDKLEEKTFDLIIVDPPYGIGAESFVGQGGNPHDYDDSPEMYQQFLELFPQHSIRLSADDAHLYVFMDLENFYQSKNAFNRVGWNVWPRPLIWDRGDNHGILTVPDFGPRNCYEVILYARKGNKRVNVVASDVIKVQGIARQDFPAQKPGEIYAELLRRSAQPGNRVLDCFAGTGPLIPAANSFGCVATCIEQNEDKYNYILARMEEKV